MTKPKNIKPYQFRSETGLISWFDLAYAALTINMIFYCFRAYFSSRKKPFQLLGVGFTCLLIADVVGVVSRAVFYENHYVVVENLSTIRMRFVSSYIEFGLYAAFTLLVLRAIHLVSSPKSGESQDIPLILAGIICVILSQLISEQAGIWFCGPGCDDPFFFPVAFAIAAIYGRWSSNYRYNFLVGFFALPYMLSLTPPFDPPSVHH